MYGVFMYIVFHISEILLVLNQHMDSRHATHIAYIIGAIWMHIIPTVGVIHVVVGRGIGVWHAVSEGVEDSRNRKQARPQCGWATP
jgi:hypothetical protein